jgi:hypothetical protein
MKIIDAFTFFPIMHNHGLILDTKYAWQLELIAQNKTS